MTAKEREKPSERQARTNERHEEYLREQVDATTNATAATDHIHEESIDLISAALNRPKLQREYDRVRRNKGAPGVDRITVREL